MTAHRFSQCMADCHVCILCMYMDTMGMQVYEISQFDDEAT